MDMSKAEPRADPQQEDWFVHQSESSLRYLGRKTLHHWRWARSEGLGRLVQEDHSIRSPVALTASASGASAAHKVSSATA